MSNKVWETRRKRQRGRGALRKVWHWHPTVRRLYPVKSDWLDYS